MHISYRPALPSDVEYCVNGMLPRGFACEPEIRDALPKLWRQWLLKGSATMAVVETRDLSGYERRVAFGLSMFVSDTFTAALIGSKVPPPVAASVARQALSGNSPVLAPAVVRRKNSAAGSGLNLLCPLIGWLPEVDDDAGLLSLVKAKLLEALVVAHAGFNLRRLLQEIYSEAEAQRAGTIGATVFTDYASFYSGGDTLPPPDERPYLCGMERETVQESSTLWPLFLYTEPIIFFSNLEQEVLRLAVMGLTDPQIADALIVSRSTVHKRWHTVLSRAAPHAAVWLPESQRVLSASPGRGAEKRHYLLNYLKSHPEELRMAERPKLDVGWIRQPV